MKDFFRNILFYEIFSDSDIFGIDPTRLVIANCGEISQRCHFAARELVFVLFRRQVSDYETPGSVLIAWLNAIWLVIDGKSVLYALNLDLLLETAFLVSRYDAPIAESHRGH